jgi:hypothetical protein
VHEKIKLIPTHVCASLNFIPEAGQVRALYALRVDSVPAILFFSLGSSDSSQTLVIDMASIAHPMKTHGP